MDRTQLRVAPSKRSGRRGFTLTETLVVVIILGVIAGFTLPMASRSMSKTRADRAAYLISIDIESAFSLAARQRRPVTFTVDSNAKRYVIRNRATSAVLVDRYMADKDSPFALSSLTMNVPSITVFPNGMASGAAKITLTVGTEQRSVTLTRAGQVRTGM
jgi:prepilin-type N-terminal cleavage/methylation domain-containing protein